MLFLKNSSECYKWAYPCDFQNGVPPKEPAFIFMIDVSYNSFSSGMVSLLCANLERVLQRLPKSVELLKIEAVQSINSDHKYIKKFHFVILQCLFRSFQN